MTRRPTIMLAAAVTMACGHLHAQQIVVQQPEFQMFTAPSTVLVPDGGSAALGGIGSAAGGRTIDGPLRMGSAGAWLRGGSSARVYVHVHDFQAMDAALLGHDETPAPRVSAPPPPSRRSGALWARPLRRPPAVAP